MKKLSLYLFLVLMFYGTSFAEDPVLTPKKVRVMNKERLNNLELGMNETEVLKTMGTKSIPIVSEPFVIDNPYKIEVHRSGENDYRILYYYTNLVKADGFITDDELTPIILKNNQLEGWGRDVWDKISSTRKFFDSIPPASASDVIEP